MLQFLEDCSQAVSRRSLCSAWLFRALHSSRRSPLLFFKLAFYFFSMATSALISSKFLLKLSRLSLISLSSFRISLSKALRKSLLHKRLSKQHAKWQQRQQYGAKYRIRHASYKNEERLLPNCEQSAMISPPNSSLPPLPKNGPLVQGSFSAVLRWWR